MDYVSELLKKIRKTQKNNLFLNQTQIIMNGSCVNVTCNQNEVAKFD